MHDEATNHSLLLPFDCDDVAFADGFELGRLWAELRAEPQEEIVVDVHARNAEMLIRIAEATERPVRSEDLDDTWVRATYGPAGVLRSP